MECQKVLDLLSLYIDGELEPSQAGAVSEHLEHCPECREEWRALKDISSMLQSLPEVDIPSDFHAGLKARLAELPVAGTGKAVRRRLPVWQNLIRGSWSKAAAFAAVAALAFGITALWYPDGLGLKVKPVEERYEALFGGAAQNQLEVKEKKKESVSDDLQELAGVQLSGKRTDTPKQKESVPVENTPKENIEVETSEAVAIPEQGELSPARTPQSLPRENFNTGIEGFRPVEESRSKVTALAGGVEFAAALDETDGAKTVGPKIQKTMTMQLEVEDKNNATSEIIIISEHNRAVVKVQQDKLFISVPAGNYEQLIGQIDDLGWTINKEALVKDVSLEYQKLADELLELMEAEKELQIGGRPVSPAQGDETGNNGEQLIIYQGKIEQVQKKLNKLNADIDLWDIYLHLQ